MFKSRLLLGIFLGILLCANPLSADVPKLLHYQGHLVDGQGRPLENNHKLTFRIYDAQIQGNLLWTQVFPVVNMQEGNFAVLLDVSTANPQLTFNAPYWLSVAVDADSEMTPRQQIATSAYSINADSVDGIQASVTPLANNLLPLNAQAKFPQSVLDIQQGPGGNFNADTVDGFHASAVATPNTILPLNASAQVPLNAIPQDQGSGLNADKVDGKEASQLLDRTNHTGVQPPSSISPQGSGSGLDADTVDGMQVEEILASIPPQPEYIDGSVLEASALTERFIYESAWTKLKELTPLARAGKVRIAWKMKSTTGYSVCGKLYINGSPWGAERCTGSGEYLTMVVSDVSVSVGDIIQIFGRSENTASVYVKDLQLLCANPTIPGESPGY